MEKFEPIMAKVVKIIDKYTVIIDAGYKNGVSSGMKFVIYSEGDEIQDLDGASLGNVEFPKAQVEITHVQEKMSVAKSATFEVTYNPLVDIATALEFSYSTRKELPVSPDSIEKVAQVDNTIRVGDKVRQIPPAPSATEKR